MQSNDPVSLGRQPTTQQTAIIAFAARYHSHMPFQDAQPTFLKEFLPGARSLGCNELQLLNHLHRLPSQKWKAAYAPLAATPPIVPLLGHCFSSPTLVALLITFLLSHLFSLPLASLWRRPSPPPALLWAQQSFSLS